MSERTKWRDIYSAELARLANEAGYGRGDERDIMDAALDKVASSAAAAAREEGWEQGREAEMEQCVEFVRNGWKNLECKFDTSRGAPPSLGYWFGKLSDALELSREAAAVARSRAAAGEQGRVQRGDVSYMISPPIDAEELNRWQSLTQEERAAAIAEFKKANGR